MVSLIAKSPLDGLVPVSAGPLILSEARLGPITSVAPFAGREAEVAQGLADIGLGWPAANRAVTAGEAACLWTGRGQAFVMGLEVPATLGSSAALTDQSDGWAALELAGAGWRDVLARLVPIDLRDGAFGVGHVPRTALNHMMSVVWRTGEASVRILVFRSMAATALRELHEAMRAVAARSHL